MRVEADPLPVVSPFLHFRQHMPFSIRDHLIVTLAYARATIKSASPHSPITDDFSEGVYTQDSVNHEVPG
jgi:hypothetical protein